VSGAQLPARGVLDTSTVILLAQLQDATTLPAEPLITTVTLAELSVGPLVARDQQEFQPARPTSNKPKPTSNLWRSTRLRHEHLVAWQHRCETPGESPQPAHTTR